MNENSNSIINDLVHQMEVQQQQIDSLRAQLYRSSKPRRTQKGFFSRVKLYAVFLIAVLVLPSFSLAVLMLPYQMAAGRLQDAIAMAESYA